MKADKLGYVVDAIARRYALVGLLVTALSYAFLFLLTLGFGVGNFTANFATLIFGLSLSYGLNRKFTFRYRGTHRRSLSRFVVVTAIAYGANLLVLQLLLTRTPAPDAVAQFIAFSIYTVIAYVLHRVWTFVDGAPAAEDAGGAV